MPAFFSALLSKILSFFGLERKETHYIGGKESLPSPLEKEEEQKLIGLLGEDPSVRDTLVEHNLRLVVYIAKKFENTGINIEDLISIGTIGLIKAINTFRADKSIKLATYASKCIENEILMSVRAEKKKNNEVSLDEPLGTDRDGNEITLADVIASAENPVADTAINNSACRAVRSAAQSILDERERIVIEMRYGFANGIVMPQREVGKKLGISRSYVSRIEKRALAKLNSCLSGKYDI